jgi:hypothetical protein
MNAKLLRGATVSIGAAGAVLAVAFVPPGAAWAYNEDDLLWTPDPNEFTTTSATPTWFGGEEYTGTGELNGEISPQDTTIVLPDELEANATVTEISSWLDYDNYSYDIVSGDNAIPAGSTIDFTYFPNLDIETVDVPDAGLFGLPEITETFFTPLGDFSI